MRPPEVKRLMRDAFRLVLVRNMCGGQGNRDGGVFRSSLVSRQSSHFPARQAPLDVRQSEGFLNIQPDLHKKACEY